MECYRCTDWPCTCKDGCTIIHGDCREILPHLPPVDLVLTDPPYSSGGLMRSDRSASTTDKYTRGIFSRSFSGDSRDQRSFEKWCGLWSAECLRATRDGGAFLTFIDWRNLPSMIDAIQVGGWVYRGIIPWDKGEGTRPVKGWFRAQVEYIVTGSVGVIDRHHTTDGLCQPGYLRCKTDRDKYHETQKPLELINLLISTRGDWQRIVDPFIGSGTTLRAAKDLNRKAIGIEIEEKYCEIAAERLRQEVLF